MKSALFLGLLAVASMAHAATYTLKVKATAKSAYQVQADITTNLPDGASLSVNLGLANQKPSDAFIGTDFQTVLVKGGRASILIDGTKRVMPVGSKLPAGTYDVEVSFYPNWEANRAVASRLGLQAPLEAVTQVRLGASGQSVSAAQNKIELQRWVRLNVNSGDRWDSAYYVAKLGPYTPLQLESGNPRVLKMLYFPKIDMTFMVNVVKNEIVVWRSGKANR
ncbi:hypothetical protein [Deinococcus multiflagellatus]|uniref:Uncharacterized protein n=1 Tax=Deinococcus multiflagellatus TaxID=1656887 RepID=A0ABW1ZTB9_9DEIO|nr:hypothetical protein [Deinococcus multiflagellatus]MBZ9715272.1 hypothetical protein [Deinococcus multiflagellatus]